MREGSPVNEACLEIDSMLFPDGNLYLVNFGLGVEMCPEQVAQTPV